MDKLRIEALKAANPIAEVARDLGLEVTRQRFRCPRPANHAHGDRTPSVSLSASRGSFKCWVCPDVKGDVIDLVRLVNGTGFPEAIRWLQERAPGVMSAEKTPAAPHPVAARSRATAPPSKQPPAPAAPRTSGASGRPAAPGASAVPGASETSGASALTASSTSSTAPAVSSLHSSAPSGHVTGEPELRLWDTGDAFENMSSGNGRSSGSGGAAVPGAGNHHVLPDHHRKPTGPGSGDAAAEDGGAGNEDTENPAPGLKALLELAAPVRGKAAAWLKSRRIFKRTWDSRGLRVVEDYRTLSDGLRRRFPMTQLQAWGLFNAAGNLRYYRHTLLLPYFDHGEPVYLQARALDPEVTPKELSLAGPIRLPYNAHLLDGTPGRLYLCEGVIDTLTLLEAGFPAVGVPGAANFKPSWVERFREKNVFVAFDADAAGEAGAAKVIALLAKSGVEAHRLRIPPGKDINDWMKSGGWGVRFDMEDTET